MVKSAILGQLIATIVQMYDTSIAKRAIKGPQRLYRKRL